MLHITDLSMLRITKVKRWAINFDYGDRHFLIHGEGEVGEGSGQRLYERFLDEKGRYSLTLLATTWYVPEDVSYDYIKRQKGQTIVYANIDKKHFAYRLTLRGFATGIMDDMVQRRLAHIEELQNELREHEKIAFKIKCELNLLR